MNFFEIIFIGTIVVVTKTSMFDQLDARIKYLEQSIASQQKKFLEIGKFKNSSYDILILL